MVLHTGDTSSLGKLQLPVSVFRDRLFLLSLFKRGHTGLIYLSTSLVIDNFKLSISIVFIRDYFKSQYRYTRMNVQWLLTRVSQNGMNTNKHAWPTGDFGGKDLKWVQASVF